MNVTVATSIFIYSLSVFFTLYYYIDRVILDIIYLAIRLIKSKLKKHSNVLKSAQESSEIIYADL